MVSSTNKTNCHDVTEILLKVALNAITLILTLDKPVHCLFCKTFKKWTYMYTVKPVLRGHLWDKEKMAL
jgi:hypothetical protein